MHPNPVVELTREEIELMRHRIGAAIGSQWAGPICDMALRALSDKAGEAVAWMCKGTYEGGRYSHVATTKQRAEDLVAGAKDIEIIPLYTAPATPQSEPSPAQIEAGRNAWQAIVAQEPHNMSIELIVSRIFRAMSGERK